MTTSQCVQKLKSKQLSFLHLNAQSLKKNHDDIVTLIHKKNLEMDFIMISETWLAPELINGYNIPGYDQVHTVPKEKVRGKGAAIYIKKTYSRSVKLWINLVLDTKSFNPSLYK